MANLSDMQDECARVLKELVATQARLREAEALLRDGQRLPGNCWEHVENCCADWCSGCKGGVEGIPVRAAHHAKLDAFLNAGQEPTDDEECQRAFDASVDDEGRAT